MGSPKPNWETDAHECFCQIKHQCDRAPWSSFSRTIVEPFHLREQSLTHRAAQLLHCARPWRPTQHDAIAAISSLLGPQPFSPPSQGGTEGGGCGRSLGHVCWDQEEHRGARLVAPISHTAPLTQGVSQLLLAFLLKRPKELLGVKSITAHSRGYPLVPPCPAFNPSTSTACLLDLSPCSTGNVCVILAQ